MKPSAQEHKKKQNNIITVNLNSKSNLTLTMNL